jgi:hypothetical protein
VITVIISYEATWIIEGSLEVKLPTIWTDEADEVGRVREEKEPEDQGARKGRKVAKRHFSAILWLRGSKSRLAQAVGAEPFGQMRD